MLKLAHRPEYVFILLVMSCPFVAATWLSDGSVLWALARYVGATVDGLPVGLSIVGAHGKDATLVAVAKALEDMA